jgi:hypothetical protein
VKTMFKIIRKAGREWECHYGRRSWSWDEVQHFLSRAIASKTMSVNVYKRINVYAYIWEVIDLMQ